MDKMKRPAATEMERFWELVASKSGRLKTRIEAVQCMAIDVRLTLMDDDVDRKPNRIAHTRQHIANELRCMTDEIETLLADLRAAPTTARTRLQ